MKTLKYKDKNMSQKLFELEGLVALVTGAGQGMGLGVARALATQGARVVINDYYAERAESAVAQLREEGFDGPVNLQMLYNPPGVSSPTSVNMLRMKAGHPWLPMPITSLSAIPVILTGPPRTRAG